MANSGTFINPLSKNIIGRDRYTLETKRKFFPIFLAEVVDLNLENKAIIFRMIVDNFIGRDDVAESTAIPLLPNISHVPVRGEIVMIYYFGKAAYYLTLNYNNSIVTNQEYLPTIPGASKSINHSNKTFNPEGKNVETTNVNEGDIVFEGRFGQSIKFGSTVKYQNIPQTSYSKSDLSENGDPILILRNGIKSFDEDIKKDDTSIYLCSTQKIELDTNENGLEAITADWSTLNVNNQIVEIINEPEPAADIHSEQNTTQPPVVTPPEQRPPVGTPLATLPNESNTAALAVLIGDAESNNNYSKIVGGSIDDSILNMTITQIDQSKYGRAQHPPNGASIGRFQIQSATALDVCRSNKINSSTFKFDTAGQDKLYQLLLNRRGYKKYLAGQLSDEQFAENLSMEWASLPKDATGVSYWAGTSTNAARVSWSSLLQAIRGLKKNVQATPNTSPAVAPTPAPNAPPEPAPASQPGYTSIADISNLPRLPKKYQRYKGGVPIGDPVTIYVIDGVPVTETIAQVFSRMKKDAWEQDKVVLQLNSSFRSMEDIVVNGDIKKGQQTLWNEYKAGTGNLAAEPGKSNHQSGIAMDINTKGPGGRKAYKWLVRNALKYRVIRAVATERWHWEYRDNATSAFIKVPRSHETWDGLADGIV